MAFTPQNFKDKTGPAVSANWLNGVDVTINGVLQAAQTVPQALTALGLAAVAGLTIPVPISQGGTGQASAPSALGALGGTTLANAQTAINPNPTQTAAELAAGVTPTFVQFLQGDIRRYGAILDGVTDDTAAIQRWLSVGGALSFPSQTALISSACILSSNTTITAAVGATITSSTGGISLFSATNKANISISGMKFVNTATTASFPVIFAHCYFVGCTRPIVQNCEFTGMNCGAVTFDNCTDPIAQNNNIYAGIYPATQQQTSDIALFGYTGPTIRGIITGNRCYGGGNFGIAVQDAYSFFNPANNLISGNRVGGSQLYGVLVYMPSYAALNTYTQVVNNYIENIQGVASIIGGSGGAGIYVVGGAAGGTLVKGNTVVNCCINTTVRGLAPAGIGISATNGALFFTSSVGGSTSGTLSTGGAPTTNANWNGATGNWIVNFSNGEQRLVALTNGATTCTWSGALSSVSILSATLAPYYNDPISVVGNKISGMTQYDGILVISNIGAGVVVSSNTINQPASNVTGYPIHVQNSSFVTVIGNVVQQQSTFSCIFLESLITTYSIVVEGNNCFGGANSAGQNSIRVAGDGTHVLNGLVISSNTLVPNVGGAGQAAIYLDTVANAQISDCSASIVTMPALFVTSCTGVRVSNNNLATTGPIAITLNGNCIGSFFDKSNGIAGGAISNSATGFHVDQFGSAAPTTGTAAKGDTIYNDLTLTSTSSRFICTAAGTPGTWTSYV
jgi:hypothetical protein